ncbi:MAG: dicarboxylate/amino acid:cation symporter [Thermoanaerobaculia bacterium]|nr:dicarboxylate/amino acid:cation symporter [Thermoanaerobaculia bacterium]
MKKIALHWQILLAMALGVLVGYLFATAGLSDSGVLDFIGLAGDIFMRLLMMIAVPLVLFSLVAGVASLSDSSRLARMGSKTIGLYLATTAVAIVIGLAVVNLIRPGSSLSESTRINLREAIVSGDQLESAEQRISRAESVDALQQILNMVPENPFAALTNASMLQVVFFSLFLGIALTRLPQEKRAPVIDMFQQLSDAIIEMVQMIMKVAPYGVFALITSLVATLGRDTGVLSDLGWALGAYIFAILVGLTVHALLVYLPLLHFVAKVPIRKFARAIVPAQLLAFSSSSSAATLPVTIECLEKGMDVDEEATSFVLPLGSTINMDGTGLYQGIAAVFIATMYNIPLDLGAQLQIVLMALLASVGTAAVPGVGIVMLVIVLKQIDLPPEGIALILAVDRPLDMCRTMLNVTGDAAVCTTVASTEGMITPGRSPAAPAKSGDSL